MSRRVSLEEVKSSMFRKKKSPVPTPEPTAGGATSSISIVEEFRTQADQASALAQIDTTHLHDPTTNPNVLRAELAARNAADERINALRHQRRLREAEHAHQRTIDEIDAHDRWTRSDADRETRAITQAQTEAAEAAEDLRAIRALEREQSPITGARVVAEQRVPRARGYLLVSVAGAAASALGVAHLVAATTGLTLWGAIPVGVLAESVLTMLIAMILHHQAHLDINLKARPKARPVGEGTGPVVRGRTMALACAGALLAISIGLNLWGLILEVSALSIIGAIGAVAATMCSALSWSATLAAGDVIAANLAEFQGAAWEEQRQELRRRAAGEYIPTRDRDVQDAGEEEVVAPARPEVVDAATEHAELVRRIIARAPQPDVDRVFDALVADLDDGDDDGDGGGGSDVPGPPPAPAGPAATAPGGASPADLRTPPPASPSASPAASGGASPEAHPQDPVLAYLAHCQRAGETPTVRGAARYAGVDPRTVRRRRDALAAAGHDMSPLMAKHKQPK
ncbi:hypothetical protein ACQEU5_25250 [Marinactinospora thermotolerans]|uniref:hypothetical protein n=1 Tax=Marinactinospora thermotolerans TaxID=531310 RepID=UPI003D94DA45